MAIQKSVFSSLIYNFQLIKPTNPQNTSGGTGFTVPPLCFSAVKVLLVKRPSKAISCNRASFSAILLNASRLPNRLHLPHRHRKRSCAGSSLGVILRLRPLHPHPRSQRGDAFSFWAWGLPLPSLHPRNRLRPPHHPPPAYA